MLSYAFAIGNVRVYLRIGPKTRTNRRFSKTRPDARTKAKKEDVSGETRTYGNLISYRIVSYHKLLYVLLVWYWDGDRVRGGRPII